VTEQALFRRTAAAPHAVFNAGTRVCAILATPRQGGKQKFPNFSDNADSF